MSEKTQTKSKSRIKQAQALREQYREVQGEVVAEFLVEALQNDARKARDEFVPEDEHDIQMISGVGVTVEDDGRIFVNGMYDQADGTLTVSNRWSAPLPEYIPEFSVQLFLQDIENGRKFEDIENAGFDWKRIYQPGRGWFLAFAARIA